MLDPMTGAQSMKKLVLEQKFSILHPKSRTPRASSTPTPSYARPTLASSIKAKGVQTLGQGQSKKALSSGHDMVTQTLEQDEHASFLERHSLTQQSEGEEVAVSHSLHEIKHSPRMGGKVISSTAGDGGYGHGELQRYVKDKSAQLSKLMLDARNVPLSVALTTNICSKIEYMYIRGNKLRGLWDTSQTPQLRVVDVSENEIESLEGMAYLTSLQHLYANSNALRSAEDVCDLPNLRLVSLSCNLLQSLEGMSGLPQLEMLCLSDNNVDSIVGLPSCPRLESLRLSGNPFAYHSAYRLATLLSAAACGIHGLACLDGVPFSEQELSLAASFAWPQRVSALYGWMPDDPTRSYEDSFSFLLSLQVGSARWEQHESLVWLEAVHGSGIAVVGRDVSFDFVWRACSKEDVCARVAHAREMLRRVEGEAERCVCMALREAEGYLGHEEALSRAAVALQAACWRFHALPNHVRTAVGGLGGQLAEALSQRKRLLPLAHAQPQAPRVSQGVQWFTVDEWGNTRIIPGADKQVYRVRAEDLGMTLKAECTCKASTSAGDAHTNSSGSDEEYTRVYEFKAFAYTRKVVQVCGPVEEVVMAHEVDVMQDQSESSYATFEERKSDEQHLSQRSNTDDNDNHGNAAGMQNMQRGCWSGQSDETQQNMQRGCWSGQSDETQQKSIQGEIAKTDECAEEGDANGIETVETSRVLQGASWLWQQGDENDQQDSLDVEAINEQYGGIGHTHASLPQGEQCASHEVSDASQDQASGNESHASARQETTMDLADGMPEDATGDCSSHTKLQGCNHTASEKSMSGSQSDNESVSEDEEASSSLASSRNNNKGGHVDEYEREERLLTLSVDPLTMSLSASSSGELSISESYVTGDNDGVRDDGSRPPSRRYSITCVPVIDSVSFSRSPPLVGIPLTLEVDCMPKHCECTFSWYRVQTGRTPRHTLSVDSRMLSSNLAVHLPVQGSTYTPTADDLGALLLVVVIPFGADDSPGDPIEACTETVVDMEDEDTCGASPANYHCVPKGYSETFFTSTGEVTGRLEAFMRRPSSIHSSADVLQDSQ